MKTVGYDYIGKGRGFGSIAISKCRSMVLLQNEFHLALGGLSPETFVFEKPTLSILEKLVIPIRLGFFYDPEPNVDNPDDFSGLSSGVGMSVKRFSLDVAYTFRTGTVKHPSREVRVYQHRCLVSLICYL